MTDSRLCNFARAIVFSHPWQQLGPVYKPRATGIADIVKAAVFAESLPNWIGDISGEHLIGQISFETLVGATKGIF